ncbi:hypothetical protein CBM2598_U30059 [Cupriavidus taiwanensis]|nr:hypothetical protein CBM2597_U30055 [Cupriavidus taiwanensis]SOZ97000.1 hypothetical protein CBM2598_U30059 [Cupriavidus taiwanensis]
METFATGRSHFSGAHEYDPQKRSPFWAADWLAPSHFTFAPNPHPLRLKSLHRWPQIHIPFALMKFTIAPRSFTEMPWKPYLAKVSSA